MKRGEFRERLKEPNWSWEKRGGIGPVTLITDESGAEGREGKRKRKE